MYCCPCYSVEESMVHRGFPNHSEKLNKQNKKQSTETIITSYYSAVRTAALANLFFHP